MLSQHGRQVYASLRQAHPGLATLDHAALLAGERGQSLDPIRRLLPPLPARERLIAQRRLACSWTWGQERARRAGR
jgi:hypothetical protein